MSGIPVFFLHCLNECGRLFFGVCPCNVGYKHGFLFFYLPAPAGKQDAAVYFGLFAHIPSPILFLRKSFLLPFFILP